MSRFKHGLVVGKFWPLHAGHSALLREAEACCVRTTVQLLANHAEDVPLGVRAAWIREAHPGVQLVAAYDDHPVDFDDSRAWDAHMPIIVGHLKSPVDAVFTSDGYGAEMARRLGATWVQVDSARRKNPVSGSAIRAQPHAYWWALAPCVRAWYTKRIVVVGAESTGTTTLAQDLAAVMATEWVPEFGREWTIGREGGLDASWSSDEFVRIAAEQSAREDAAARSVAVPWLVCDTDALATAVWHERYIGYRLPSLESLARLRPPWTYVLTCNDIPFVQDGWRDGQHVRQHMTDRFRAVLADQPVCWIEVAGSRQTRVDEVMTHVQEVDARASCITASGTIQRKAPMV
ncbi:MAG: AAA family ATPase [Actinomycetota bacterium]|nr:AAA family ATPase [Actinomycetota bacterium]